MLQNIESGQHKTVNQGHNLKIEGLMIGALNSGSKDIADVPFDEKYHFTEFIPPGRHYFYFVRVIARPTLELTL